MTGRIRPQLIGEVSSLLMSRAVPCLNPIRRCAWASALSQCRIDQHMGAGPEREEPQQGDQRDQQQGGDGYGIGVGRPVERRF